MRRLGHQDPPEAGGLRILGAVVERQLVHRLEVEGEAALTAVDLDAHRVLASGGEPGCLERRDRATRETAVEQRRIVDGHVAERLTAGGAQATGRPRNGTLLDERLGESG